MCRPTRQNDISSNNNGFLERIGGESQYDFLIMTFCDSILEDAALQGFFQNFEMEAMAALMKRFLGITFQSSARLDVTDEDVRGKIVLRNYALFEMGLSQTHFEQLQSHFEFALHDSWLEEEVMNECKGRFNDLRKVFEMERQELEEAAITQRALASQILAASS